MHSLITSYLIQSKECMLPGIGVLQIIHTPASTDVANNRILPPFEGIIFKREDHPASAGLVKYISRKKHIDLNEADDLLSSFCNEWKAKIAEGEKLHLETIGSIQNDGNGNRTFVIENNFNVLQPITVDNVYQKASEPVLIEEVAVDEPVLSDETKVEDKEEVIVERSYWGLWALILLAIGLVVIFYHFKDGRLNGASIGNQHKHVIDSVGATYQLPK